MDLGACINGGLAHSATPRNGHVFEVRAVAKAQECIGAHMVVDGAVDKGLTSRCGHGCTLYQLCHT